MIKQISRGILPALLLPAALSFGEQPNGHELAWLAGCWESVERDVREVWVVEHDNALAGFGIAIRDGNIAFYEVLSIRRPAEGGPLVYTAHPSGQASASFEASVVAENSVLFVNPDHDYPQEIRYARSSNQLQAKTSLLGGLSARTLDLRLCD